MGAVVDLEKIRREMRLNEIKADLPGINTAMMQLMARLRDDVELDHRLKGALGLKTSRSAFMDGLEVEYTLENKSLSVIRKIACLRFKGFDITKDVPESEIAPYLVTLMEVFLTQGGRPAKEFTAAPDGVIDVIGFVQDVVPMVFINQNPNLVTNFGGIG